MSDRRVAVLVPPQESAGLADRSDTFLQAAEINECLSILGNECLTINFADDRLATASKLSRAAPDVVVNLVEDVPEGPDQLHLATEMLDKLRLPYTGAKTAALRALADKRHVKAALRRAGLPTPAEADGKDGAFIVKSAIEHASIGIDAQSVVASREVAAAIDARQRQFGGPWFAEAYIEGREFNVGLLGPAASPRVLPVAEILFLASAAGRPNIVGYDEKWAADSAAYAQTPRSFPHAAADQDLLAELARLGRAAWRLFGLAGYARIDFRVDAAGQPYIVDVNANPCLSRDAGFCAAARELGLSQTEIVANLIETALA